MTMHDTCRRCDRPGHAGNECSLRWRQYTLAGLVEGADASRIYRVCYNCTGLDHFGDECPYERKRADWTIFHEPDPAFIRLATIQQRGSRSSRPKDDKRDDRKNQGRERDHNEGDGRRSHPRHGRASEERPSPNWRKMRADAAARVVTEANYYDHFDGTYGGKQQEPAPARRGTRNNDTSRPSPSGQHKGRGGYGPSKRSNKGQT
jgi:hypothetical protein